MESIYSYSDFRAFLSEYYREKKAANRHFSHRYVAGKVGLKSSGHFSAILKGKANISPEVTARFCEFMKLKKRESEYFESMVAFSQAKTEAARHKAYERLISHKECKVQIVGPDRFEYYASWHTGAILRILDFYPFAGNFSELARLAEPLLTVSEAKKAVALLTKLDFIRRRPDGTYAATDRTLSTGYDAQSPHIRSFLGQSIDLAQRAIDAFPRAERNISTLLFSVSEETYRKIEQESRLFRRKIMGLAEADSIPTRAYQFSMQVFPLSKRYPRKVPA